MNNTSRLMVAAALSTTLAGAARTDGAGSTVGWGSQKIVPDEELVNLVAVEARAYHTLGLRSDGSVTAWGRSDFNRCDPPPSNAEFKALAAGWYHSMALSADGSITAWGYNESGQCAVPAPNSGFTGLAAGWYHSLGLKEDGSIVAWAWNLYGQCDVPPPPEGR